MEKTRIDYKRLYKSICFKNDDGETALHVACRKRAPYYIIKLLTDIGGSGLVMTTDSFGGSLALHHCCRYGAELSVVRRLLFIGGYESVSMKDAIGNLPLHWALSKNASPDVIKLLIELGGPSTITTTNSLGWNALQAASHFSSKYVITKMLCDIGGEDAIRYVNKNGEAALDILYEKNPFDKESIRYIQKKVGAKLLTEKTIDLTMDWIFRQPETVQEDSFMDPFIQNILNHECARFRFLSILILDLTAQCLLITKIYHGYNAAIILGDEKLNFANLLMISISTGWLGFRTMTHMISIPFSSWSIELANWLGRSENIELINFEECF